MQSSSGTRLRGINNALGGNPNQIPPTDSYLALDRAWPTASCSPGPIISFKITTPPSTPRSAICFSNCFWAGRVHDVWKSLTPQGQEALKIHRQVMAKKSGLSMDQALSRREN